MDMNDRSTNICYADQPSVASTIGKAAIVILVAFSIPLQVHPCRASIDAVVKWRPSKARQIDGGSSSPSNGPASAADHGHGAGGPQMSDLRFALITTVIIVGSYAVALSVSSLDRVLAYVGSTGSTSISFILPGLFYYKISDPDSIHHQALAKEDDDVESHHHHHRGGGSAGVEAGDDDPHGQHESAGLLGGDLNGGPQGGSGVGLQRRTSNAWAWRKRWKFSLEDLEAELLRKMSLGLAIYGMVVMAVCLTMNTFFIVSG